MLKKLQVLQINPFQFALAPGEHHPPSHTQYFGGIFWEWRTFAGIAKFTTPHPHTHIRCMDRLENR